MLSKQDKINELRAQIEELESTCDIFSGGHKKSTYTAKFGRVSSFDEDIKELLKKYKGTVFEVFTRHMVDSLILFNHNRNQVEDVNTSDKFGSTQVWEAIQILTKSEEFGK